ncbi:MAG: hypothetical protein RIT15_853, partial [Pseudomonadota bacterium]
MVNMAPLQVTAGVAPAAGVPVKVTECTDPTLAAGSVPPPTYCTAEGVMVPTPHPVTEDVMEIDVPEGIGKRDCAVPFNVKLKARALVLVKLACPATAVTNGKLEDNKIIVCALTVVGSNPVQVLTRLG